MTTNQSASEPVMLEELHEVTCGCYDRCGTKILVPTSLWLKQQAISGLEFILKGHKTIDADEVVETFDHGSLYNTKTPFAEGYSE